MYFCTCALPPSSFDVRRRKDLKQDSCPHSVSKLALLEAFIHCPGFWLRKSRAWTASFQPARGSPMQLAWRICFMGRFQERESGAGKGKRLRRCYARHPGLRRAREGLTKKKKHFVAGAGKSGKILSERIFSAFGGFTMAQNKTRQLRWFWAMYASKWHVFSSSSLQEWPQTKLFAVFYFFVAARQGNAERLCRKAPFWLLEVSHWPGTAVVWKVPDYL